jgi:hypothetical protein
LSSRGSRELCLPCSSRQRAHLFDGVKVGRHGWNADFVMLAAAGALGVFDEMLWLDGGRMMRSLVAVRSPNDWRGYSVEEVQAGPSRQATRCCDLRCRVGGAWNSRSRPRTATRQCSSVRELTDTRGANWFCQRTKLFSGRDDRSKAELLRAHRLQAHKFQPNATRNVIDPFHLPSLLLFLPHDTYLLRSSLTHTERNSNALRTS